MTDRHAAYIVMDVRELLEEMRGQARQRLALDEPDFDWSMLGRGEMEGLWKEAEEALDRALEIAEERQRCLDGATDWLKQRTKERNEARSDALKLRDELNLWASDLVVQEETESYEQYRGVGS